MGALTGFGYRILSILPKNGLQLLLFSTLVAEMSKKLHAASFFYKEIKKNWSVQVRYALTGLCFAVCWILLNGAVCWFETWGDLSTTNTYCYKQ